VLPAGAGSYDADQRPRRALAGIARGAEDHDASSHQITTLRSGIAGSISSEPKEGQAVEGAQTDNVLKVRD
jgi:hypothetical protein